MYIYSNCFQVIVENSGLHYDGMLDFGLKIKITQFNIKVNLKNDILV